MLEDTVRHLHRELRNLRIAQRDVVNKMDDLKYSGFAYRQAEVVLTGLTRLIRELESLLQQPVCKVQAPPSQKSSSRRSSWPMEQRWEEIDAISPLSPSSSPIDVLPSLKGGDS